MNTSNVIPFRGKVWNERFLKKTENMVFNEPNMVITPAAFREGIKGILLFNRYGRTDVSETTAVKFADTLYMLMNDS